MSNANRPMKGVVVLLISILIAVMIGCGGGGGGGTSSGGGTTATTGATTGATTATTGTNGSGSMSFTLQWPVQTRSIPSYAQSIVISVYTFNTTNIVAQQIVNRSNPAAYNQTITINVPPGKYTVVAEAKPGLNGAGDTIASVTLTITVANGQTTSTTINPTTLITKLFIDNLPSQASVGQTIQLTAHAEDANHNAILLPAAALDWSIISGSQFASITSRGQLTVLGVGTVTVQVREIETDITATKSITFVQGSTNGVVIIVS